MKRTCCDTEIGQDHRACPELGYNKFGVPMCKCLHYGPAHAWEPGEACSPVRVIPDWTEIDR